MRYVAAALMTLLVLPLVAQSPALEFEVASIKRNVSSVPPDFHQDPASGVIRMLWVPARILILQAYPMVTPPFQMLNLPSWANDKYDLIAKGKPNPSAEERQQMFRALFADRMKLAAHYETREAQGYDLVLIRPGTLGPRLKPSTLDCSGGTTPPPPPDVATAKWEELAAERCGILRINNAWITGGAPFDNLVRIMTPDAGRAIVNKTGLTGNYAFTFRYQNTPLPAGREPSLDDSPSLMTALREQLGMKLEPTTAQERILVIDHIERPTEN